MSDFHNRFECMARQKRLNGHASGGTPRRACLACEMDRLFSQCFAGHEAPFAPHGFLHAMWCSAEHFAGHEQQDAHEFLIAMLAGICDGLCGPAAAPSLKLAAPLNPLNGGINGGDSAVRMAQLGPKRVRLSAVEPGAAKELLGVFSGVLRSDVTCLACGASSTKLEEFHDISLDVAKAPKTAANSSPALGPSNNGLGGGGSNASGSGGSSDERSDKGVSPPPALDGAAELPRGESVLECLRSFTQEEKLTARRWCERCGGERESCKRLSIQRLPNVLCLHLKRFEQTGHGKAASKIDSFVGFPLHSLNMWQYTSAHLCARPREAAKGDENGGKNGMRANGRAAESPPPELPEPGAEHLYDLFGVAVHRGKITNGHYTAFVRRHASWFHCDDATITPASPSAVRACQGYLLFYVRKKLC